MGYFCGDFFHKHEGELSFGAEKVMRCPKQVTYFGVGGLIFLCRCTL